MRSIKGEVRFAIHELTTRTQHMFERAIADQLGVQHITQISYAADRVENGRVILKIEAQTNDGASDLAVESEAPGVGDRGADFAGSDTEIEEDSD